MATIHELDKRLVALETTVKLGLEHIAERIDKLAEDFSDQGKTPRPASASGGWKLKLAPGSGREIAYMLIGLAGLLGGIGGPVAASLLQEPESPPIAAPLPATVTP